MYWFASSFATPSFLVAIGLGVFHDRLSITVLSESYLAAAGEGIAIHSPRMSPGAVQSVHYNFRDKFYP